MVQFSDFEKSNMASGKVDSRTIDGIGNRNMLAIPEANVPKSPSLKNRFQKYQMDDLFTGSTNSPPPSPRIQIKRSTVNAVLGHRTSNADSNPLKKELQPSDKKNLHKTDSYAGNLAKLQKDDDKPSMKKSISSPGLSETNICEIKISEEVKKRNIKPISLDSDLSTASATLSSAPLMKQRDQEVMPRLKNSAFSENQKLSSIIENYEPSSHEYWLTSKLGKIFRRTSADQIIPHEGETSKNSTEDKSKVLVPNDNQEKHVEHHHKETDEKTSLLHKLTTWLTTSEDKHRHIESDSDDEDSSFKNTGKAVYEWSTKKKVKVNHKDLNILSPTSL